MSRTKRNFCSNGAILTLSWKPLTSKTAFVICLISFRFGSYEDRRLTQTGVLNYSSRPKLSFGSAHVKFGVWPGPKSPVPIYSCPSGFREAMREPYILQTQRSDGRKGWNPDFSIERPTLQSLTPSRPLLLVLTKFPRLKYASGYIRLCCMAWL